MKMNRINIKNRLMSIVFLILLIATSFFNCSFAAPASFGCGISPGYTNCINGNNTYSGASCSATSTTAVCNSGDYKRCRSLFAGGMLINCCCKETSCDDACRGNTSGFPSCTSGGNYASGRDWHALNTCNSFEDQKFFSPIGCGAVGSIESQNKCCCTRPNCGNANGEGCAGYSDPGQVVMGGSCPALGGPFNVEGMCCCPVDCGVVCGVGGSPATGSTCPDGSYLNSQCCCQANCGNGPGAYCEGFDGGSASVGGICLTGEYPRGPNNVCCCTGMFTQPPGTVACP
jgi:hypothetical protein